MKYTSGPIEIMGQNSQTTIQGFTVIGKDGLPTAYVALHSDAVLYAAAPKLLEALKRLHNECCMYGVGPQILNYGPMLEPTEEAVLIARKIISEVEGGAPC